MIVVGVSGRACIHTSTLVLFVPSAWVKKPHRLRCVYLHLARPQLNSIVSKQKLFQELVVSGLPDRMVS